MSSASRFDVVLSESAFAYLQSLPQKKREALATHLLTLYKNAAPKQSRTLHTRENERIWIAGSYEILFEVLPDARRIEIAIIRPIQR